MNNFLYYITVITSIFYIQNIYSQDKIRIGVWEKFDALSLPESTVYKNDKEIKNNEDDDKNGYVDDIIGIGFDENETIITERFEATFQNSKKYDHGTAVASIIAKNNQNVLILGVGFEPTTTRLTATYLYLTVKERLRGFKAELKKMDYFVQESLLYFAKNKVQIVNISWGLDLDYFASINKNLGNNDKEIRENSHKWLIHFREVLEKNMKKYPKIIFVIAAGNEGQNCEKAYDVPALISLPNTIVVGANSIKGERWEYSNYGETVDVYAPGENIKYQIALKRWSSGSGTSVAAPYVTKLIAKKLSDGRSFLEIKKELKKIKNL